MPRPITLFTGQWADLPFEEVARLASELGLRRPRDRLLGRPPRPVAGRRGRRLRPGQARPAGEVRPQGLRDLQPPQGPGRLRRPDRRPARGDPVRAGLGRRRPRGRAAARGRGDEDDRARSAQRLGVDTVVGFTGSSIWKYVAMFPPATEEMVAAGYRDFADRWNPILDVFDECGVRFAHEVHPSEIAYDYWTTVAHDGGDRPPARRSASTGTRATSSGRTSTRSASSGTSRTGSTTSTARTRSARSATAATAGSARTCRGPTRAAAGTSCPPATATCRGSSASGCSTPSATTARSRSSGRTPAWTACVGAPEALEFVRRLAFDAPDAAFDAAFSTKE